MKHEAFLRTHPVFTSKEFEHYLYSRGVAKRTREALIRYYCQTGRIARVKRGLFVTVPAGFDPEIFEADPFLLASRLTPDAVLSYHTALEFYGNAYSVRNVFVYSAARPAEPLSFHGRLFRGARFPSVLKKAGKEYFDVHNAESSGADLRVTGLERTMVDTLDRPYLSGSWEEIWRSLESIAFFNIENILEYVFMLGNATTSAKVGFFLEQHRNELMVEDSHLKQLMKLRPRSPHYLSRSRRESGRFVPEWNLVVPVEVLERSWMEVL